MQMNALPPGEGGQLMQYGWVPRMEGEKKKREKQRKRLPLSIVCFVLSFLFLLVSIFLMIGRREKVPVSLYLQFEEWDEWETCASYIKIAPLLVEYQKIEDGEIVKRYEEKPHRIEMYAEETENKLNWHDYEPLRLSFAGEGIVVSDVQAFCEEAELPVSFTHGDYVLDFPCVYGEHRITVKGSVRRGNYTYEVTYLFVVDIRHV